jgi:chitobiase/beta-hexosaminidase-like protein
MMGNPPRKYRCSAFSLRSIVRVVLCLAVMMLGLLSPHAAGAQVINFPSGFASQPSTIWLENASVYSGSSIQVIANVGHTANNAMFETPVNVQAFTTTFTFHFDCSGSLTVGDCGDGIAFYTICACTSGNFRYPPGYTYSGFSSQNFSWSNCDPSNTPECSPLIEGAAIKFDLFNNQTAEPGAEFTGYYTGGEIPQYPNPVYEMSGSGINFQSGDEFRATITYNGATLTEKLTDTNTNASYTISYLADIPAANGYNNTALVGFGGGTGEATALGYVDSWVYTVNTSGAATPTYSVGGGAYSSVQSVSLSTTSPGAVICYSTTQQPATNGSTGCRNGTLYTGPVTVSNSETLYSVTGGTGYSDSVPVGAATYYMNSQTAVPTITLPGGSYTFPQTTTINNTTVNAPSSSSSLGALNYYCTTAYGGSCTPSTGLSSLLTISSAETVCTNAVTSGHTTSATVCYNYAAAGSSASTPTFTPVAATYNGAQSVTLSTASAGAVICYNTSGSPATNGSAGCATGTVYVGPVSVSSSETLYAVAGGTGYSDSAVGSASYVIQNAVATPTFSPAAGTYTSAQSVTISDVTLGATIYYTTNGSTPTTSSTAYTGPIAVSSTETLQAIAVVTGDTNSAVGSASYVIQNSVATPTFSPAAGTYTSAQSVTISDVTLGATIYYTANGSAPTTSSTRYTGPITVSATEMLQAIAVATGANSAVASAAYTITSPPYFTLVASPTTLTGNAGNAETVTLTVTPQNGFDSPVSFACSGLPTGATCSFSPATVTPSGAAVTTQLTISSGAQSSALRPGSRPFFPFTALAVTVCLFGCRNRRWHHWLLLAVICSGLGLLSGCGGSGGTSSTATPTSTTSMVTVTATSGTLQGTATITLTVN